MERLKLLFSELIEKTPKDWWLNEVSSIFEDGDEFFLKDFEIYGKALDMLDTLGGS